MAEGKKAAKKMQSYSRKITVMAEQEGTYLWTVAVLIDGDL
jgi:hypothetical protein